MTTCAKRRESALAKKSKSFVCILQKELLILFAFTSELKGSWLA